MIYRRERPVCRKALIHLTKKYNCGLEELLHHPTMMMSPNLCIQARKMIEESKFKTAKQLKDEERQIAFRRAVGLIR